MGSITDVFTNDEIQILKGHFKQKKGKNENSKILLSRRIASTKTDSPARIVEIDPADLLTLIDLGPSPTTGHEGAGAIRGLPTQGNRAIIIDTDNTVLERQLPGAVIEQLGVLNAPSGEAVTGLEFTSDGTLYGISTNGTNSSLLQINTNTWNATVIGNNNLTLPINLARDGNDNLYTVDINDDKLYRLDKTNGSATLIGDIGFAANFGQGMFFSSEVNKILFTAFNNDVFDSELREVNTDTGMTTFLGTITPGSLNQYSWAAEYDKDLLIVEDFDKNNFSFYPNPANEFINLESSNTIESVEIYSILGQKMIMKTIKATNSNLNISHLPSGNYILKIFSNHTVNAFKLKKN
jgi:hypothetical protein